VSEGIVGLLTIHPIPPSTITTTTTNNFTLLGLGYKAATGTLYADGTIGGDVSGQGAAVFTLNPSTGAPTTLGYAGVTAGSSLSSGGLAYDPATGALYSIGSVTGSSDGLYTINTSTGDATLVATFSPDIGALGGLAFAPTAIPEPSAFASIVGVAALGLAAWRRGRWRR